MSLDHNELLMDRLTPASEPEKLSPAEEKLNAVTAEKQHLMLKQSQAFLEELFAANATLPVKIDNVQINGGERFRDSFLRAQMLPLLKTNLTTLEDFLQGVDSVWANLAAHDVLENGMVALHNLPGRPWQLQSSLNAVAAFSFIPKKRFYAKTGTNIGNGEGDGYIQFELRNLFGGAERLVFDAVTGTKTPALYMLNYSQPVFNSARYAWDTLAYINTRKLEWIQSTAQTTGVTTKMATRFRGPWNFDVALENCMRSTTNVALRSMAVLRQLHPALKSSVLVNARYDTRDHTITPSKGTYMRLGLEKSGLFAFNNFSYTKLVYELQTAHTLSDTHSLIFSNRAGALFGANGESSIVDRFHIGGPNDVRSFSLQGLGPKDNNSCVGGDYFVSGGLSLISHIPRTPKDTNFKWHTFINFGKLVAGNRRPAEILKDLCTQHSIGVGTGILYNHPLARFELNFVLPLAAHTTDYVRKGIQYGVGISFL